MTSSKIENVVADFETTSAENYKVDGKVRVWGWSVWSVNKNKLLGKGNNIKKFFEFLSRHSYNVFFHNLKFDGVFIIYELLTQNFKYDEKLKKENSYNCLIDERGSWYNINIKFKDYGTRRNRTFIYDSLKKIPISVEKIAKTFKLADEKGVIDYIKYREENYNLTEDEELYIEKDVKIVAQALKKQFDIGLTKMTISSDAYNDFKNEYKDKWFKTMFPVLDNTTDNDIRKAYKGGFVWCNPLIAGKKLGKVTSYDVNSLYPSVMYQCKLPFGVPIAYKGKYEEDSTHPLYIQLIDVEFELKPNHIPTIQLKHSLNFMPTEYVTSSKGEMIQLCLTNVDLELFFNQYNIKRIKYLSGFKFRGRKGFFKDFIDKWYHIKETSTDAGEIYLAKRILNSLYGKFATKCERRNQIPYLDEDKNLKFKLSDVEITPPKYTAIACFITAYARYKTITSAQKNFERFCYADTDSIHLLGDEPVDNIEIHQKQLGAWKNEGTCKSAMFLRAKTYLKEFEDENGISKFKVTCAGMPECVKTAVNFDNFKIGERFTGKKQQKRVKGGVLISTTEFTIKK